MPRYQRSRDVVRPAPPPDNAQPPRRDGRVHAIERHEQCSVDASVGAAAAGEPHRMAVGVSGGRADDPPIAPDGYACPGPHPGAFARHVLGRRQWRCRSQPSCVRLRTSRVMTEVTGKRSAPDPVAGAGVVADSAAPELRDCCGFCRRQRESLIPPRAWRETMTGPGAGASAASGGASTRTRRMRH